MELNTYRLNSLEEPTDAQLHALMEQVAMSARESSRHAELELKHRMQAVKELFCVVMFGLINVNILYYSFSTLYQMCNLRQSL